MLGVLGLISIFDEGGTCGDAKVVLVGGVEDSPTTILGVKSRVLVVIPRLKTSVTGAKDRITNVCLLLPIPGEFILKKDY